MSTLKEYEIKQNIKQTIRKAIIKTLDIIFFPLRYLYQKYEPSKLRKRINAKKYRKKMINNLYGDLLYFNNLILTDCWVSQDDNNDIISTGNYSVNLSSYKYFSGKSSSEILDEILNVFKQDNHVKVQEIRAEDIFKWGYDRYKEKTFYKVTIKKGEIN